MKQFFLGAKKIGGEKKGGETQQLKFRIQSREKLFFRFFGFFSFPRDSLEGQNVSPTFSGEEIKLKKLKEKKKRKRF